MDTPDTPLLSEADQKALETLLRKLYGENYEQRDRDRSGTLRKAVEGSNIELEQSESEAAFTVTLADLTRPARGKEQSGVSTRLYGPVVFTKAAIRKPGQAVVFSAAGQTRDPYSLTDEQEDNITAEMGSRMAQNILSRYLPTQNHMENPE